MAVCVISAVVDTDDPRAPMRPACVVHTEWAPCLSNGEPASPVALEACDGQYGGSRDGALANWALKTRQQRPLVLHHGDWGDDRLHDGGRGCWCRPEYLEANS